MTQSLSAHFDGRFIVPDEPVQLPVGRALRVQVELVEDARAFRRASPLRRRPSGRARGPVGPTRPLPLRGAQRISAGARGRFRRHVYWIALLVKQDQNHERARAWTPLIGGRITTTALVLVETANALARPAWRAAAVALIEHLRQRPDVHIVPAEAALWERGWDLYRSRPDKGWSLTDCVSFVVMQDAGLTDALTTDEHFCQAGFRAVLLEEPASG